MQPQVQDVRVWVDDQHPIFRRGLVSCLAGEGFTIAGESSSLRPMPDLSEIDVLLFQAEHGALAKVLTMHESTRAQSVWLVALVASQDEPLALDLFGKRSAVNDGHDRYANILVAYLLQRMEQFDGISLLATNLSANLDDAFARRIDLRIVFPLPEPPERRRLWERHLPPSLPTTGELDIDFLAGAFRVAGGDIRNITLTAAYQAASHDRPVAMADLVRATAQEYRKLGRLCTEEDFGPYFHLAGH